jgi:agmatinase
MALYYAKSLPNEAEVVILGVPYDRTSSFMPGSRFAPPQIRTAADNIESYSPLQDRDLGGLRIADAGDLFFEDVRWPAVAAQVRSRAAEIVRAGRLPVALGGEHTITTPLVQACAETHPGLAVLQFDAHADLRTEFLGEEFSHATAMYQTGRIVGPECVFQFGIRSGTRDEFAAGRNLHRGLVLEPLRRTRDGLRSRPLYLTIDIDVLDPSVMPAVATPEPGGIGYDELRQALLELRGCRIVGIDIVEYNPLANRDLAPAALVAALLREAILVARGA